MLKPIEMYPMGQIIAPNPPVAEAPFMVAPRVDACAVVGPDSFIIGDVTVAPDVFIGFHNVIRNDAVQAPCYIGPRCNIQDFVLMHVHPGESLTVAGMPYGFFIDANVSMLHHCAPHGPLFIGANTFIGQHVSIYGAAIGRNCVIMHGAVIAEKVKIADNRFVAPGQAVWKQEQADALPLVEGKFKTLNAEVADYYFRLGKAYLDCTPMFI